MNEPAINETENQVNDLVVADLIEMLETLPPYVLVRVGLDADPATPAFRVNRIAAIRENQRRPYDSIDHTETVWLGVEPVDEGTESNSAPRELWDRDEI